MAELIGEKGNVIVIEGIPGYSASDQQNKGVLAALDEYPNVNVVGQLANCPTTFTLGYSSNAANTPLFCWSDAE